MRKRLKGFERMEAQTGEENVEEILKSDTKQIFIAVEDSKIFKGFTKRCFRTLEDIRIERQFKTD